MYKNRGQALTKCIIHLLPVTAALGIVILNLTQFYVGGELRGTSGEDVQKLAALQFAAKLHELLMLASLGAIIFTYIRKELAFGEGIPFGALFAGFQIDKISLLWSSEFWGTLTHKWRLQRRTKVYVVSLIVACTILGVSVGPSTANLMKPRLDDWPAGGTDFWINDTEIFPTMVQIHPAIAQCTNYSRDAACPHGGWESINDDYLSFWPQLVPLGSLPETFSVAGLFSLREIFMRQRTATDGKGASWASAYTFATTQMSAPADALTEVGRLWAIAAASVRGVERFNYRKDSTFTTSASQPFVVAYCKETIIDVAHPPDLKLNFPVLSSLYTGHATIVTKDVLSYVTVNDTAFTGQIFSSLESSAPPTLLWFDPASHGYETNNSINAVAVFPNTTAGYSAIYVCGVDSRLAPNDIQSTRNLPKHVTGGPASRFDIGINPAWPKVMMTPEWASLLNPFKSSDHPTVFSEMASTAGMWNSTRVSQSYNYPFIIESILSTSVADGLARTSYGALLTGTLNGQQDGSNSWFHDILPKNGRLGWGSSAFTVTDEERENATMFTMYATVNGYAYSRQGATQKAAIAVLLLYACLAVSHVIYSGRTGWTSTAWDTMPEIAALAMSSTQTAKLQNTGAGIATVGVYQETVRTRVKEQHIEFVFDDTREASSMVLVNEKYA